MVCRELAAGEPDHTFSRSRQMPLVRANGARLAPVVALALGATGVSWRIVMLLLDVPPTNSDEAAAGLAALHIAQGRDYPIFFYGQHYMGTIQSFLAAPLFALFGPSTLLLRVPPLVAYGLLLLLMYRLSVKILGPWVAVAAVGVLAFASDRLVKNELIGAGGYPELGPMLVALFLIPVGLSSNSYKRPNWFLAAWGLIWGLTFWTHWLSAPYLVGAAIVLLVTCWRRLRGAAGLITLTAMMVGAGPLLWHNMTAPREFNSVSTFLSLTSAGGDPSVAERTLGGVLIGLPLASGHCSPGYCDEARRWWGPVYLALLGVAAVWSARALRRGPSSDRVRYLTILILALSAVFTVMFYLRSPAAAETPNESARYLHYLLVSTPVWIWVLWRLVTGVWGRVARVSAMLVASVVTLTMLLATAELAGQAHTYSRWARESRQLITVLNARGVDHMYAGYWTCNRIIFDTAEDIICAVLEDDLRRGLNRYPAYWDDVTSKSDSVVFVTKIDSAYTGPELELDAAVRKRLADAAVPVTVTRVAGYVLYQPSGPVSVP